MMQLIENPWLIEFWKTVDPVNKDIIVELAERNVKDFSDSKFESISKTVEFHQKRNEMLENSLDPEIIKLEAVNILLMKLQEELFCEYIINGGNINFKPYEEKLIEKRVEQMKLDKLIETETFKGATHYEKHELEIGQGIEAAFERL